jgi:sec-independent protein translocase protein TatA
MEIFGLGAPELLLILFVLLLFFGKDKLPDLARSVGTSFRELKKGFAEGDAKGTDGNTESGAAKKKS